MGKGDIKSTKGKRTRGSYGNTRKRKKVVKITPAKPKKKVTAKKTAAKKPATKKTTAKKTTTKVEKEEKEEK